MSLRRALSLSALQKLLGPRVATWLCISFGFSLVLSAVELGIAGFLQLFLSSLGILSDSVQLAGAFGIRKLFPGTLAIGLLAIGAVRAVAQYLLAYSASVTQENITLRLRRIAIWEMLLHPSRAFVSASSVTTRLSEHFVKASYFAYAGTNFLAMAVQVVVLALLLLFSAPFETLVAFSGLLVLGIVVLRLNRAAGRKAARVPEQLEIVTRGIQLVARNFFLVRAVRTERAEHQRLSQAVDRYAEEGIGAGSLSSVAAALTPFVGTVLIVAIVVFSQHVMHTPGIRLLSFLYLFLRFVQTLGTAVVHMTNCNQTAPQFARSLSYVDGFSREQVAQAMAPESVPGNDAAADDADAAAVVPPAIRAAGLSFRYSDDDRPVLDNVSFEVRAGSQFAVVGPSGSGKSTLLALVLGLSEPTSGTITVDGQAPVRYFERPEARVGYVGADPFLLAGTLRENLVYGLRRPVSDATLHRALADAKLTDAVAALPKGLDHPIREDGAGLSAGQKQRLCLARALLMRPSVLVLDEVSANLDEATEAQLAETLRALFGRVTIVLVSHRPGILVHADARHNLSPFARHPDEAPMLPAAPA
jgi:ABC-type multidrug transport system fused ATPase/permease subunit